MRGFANGLRKDRDAAVAGPTLRRNPGPVEGRVNTIAMLKRRMSGCARLDLLRKRVLLSAR
ncbi:transposase [Kitasatospora sp. RG8]|uniref:transposase n=1 Tax=Kitasatospora sp. RG8 TaxID=2820815 RepID=UPI001ADF10D6|nr:transposase [Kitasatospora sp. RG8]MBP0451056.1 transposase [Kitasatospora sp. RG8]